MQFRLSFFPRPRNTGGRLAKLGLSTNDTKSSIGEVMGFRSDLIRESFERVRPMTSEAADHFYDRLFTQYPESRDLFRGTNMKLQKRLLMSALSSAVDAVDDLEAMTPILHQMGKRHSGYGVQIRHYPWAGDALLGTLEHLLGDAWNGELKQAWSEFYDELADSMIRGAQNSTCGAGENHRREPPRLPSG